MKKLTVGLAVLLLGYATTSFAALPTTSSKNKICERKKCGGLTFGVTGIYVRPYIDHVDYALTFPDGDVTDVSAFINGTYQNVIHEYDWGYKVHIGYIFPCSGNEVALTYTHWDNDEKNYVDGFNFGFATSAAPFAFGFPIDFVSAPINLTGLDVIGGVPGETILAGTLPAFTFDLLFTPDDLVALSVHSEVKNHTWDLDFKQSMNVGSRLTVSWFGGIRYSRLDRDLEVTQEFAISDEVIVAPTLAVVTIEIPGELPFVGPATITVTPILDVTATLRDIVRQNSKFEGVGPRFGFDAKYHLGAGFGVLGSISTALLIGEHEANISERGDIIDAAFFVPNVEVTSGTLDLIAAELIPADATLTTPPVIINYRHPDEPRVVPNIEAKLGFDWIHQLHNCSRSLLTIELGYLFSHYFNAIDRLSVLDAFAPELRTRETMDLSFEGPYVGVQVQL